MDENKCQVDRRGRTEVRPRAFLCLAALVLGAQAAGAETPASRFPPGYVSEVLDNGLRVSVLADPALPIVATPVEYHVGAANEDEGSRGLAHLFEHLMFGATETRDKRDYWHYHHRNGGTNNAWTSYDETVYVSEISPEHFVGVLEREADRMVNLVLTQEELDNEIRIVTEELRLSTENDPMSRAFNQATKALFGEHPYAIWPTGTKEDIAAATLESCSRFYERFYGPSNAHLVVVGPVDAPSTLATVKRLFGAIPAGGETPPDVPSLFDWEFPEMTRVTEDLPPVEVALLAFPLPPPGSEDQWAIAVLRALLVGGKINPFREELVRRRHKAVEAGTQTLSQRRGGAIAFYAVNLPYRRERTAFRLMEQTRDKLSGLEWLNAETLAAAKRSLRQAELNRVYYAGAIARQVGRSRWWFDDETVAFDRGTRIDAVSIDDVREAWQRYVADRPGVRLYVKPEKVPLWIRLFGWLYPLVD